MSIRIALAGNPNSGKTTLFNALTGSNQFVGNWPGVTVEKKEGKLKKHDDVIITDLPGIYSLSPYTLEEVVARKYLIDEHPDAILNIVDATNLERNLYLTTQLTELGIPVVIALNMMDVVAKAKDIINTEELSNRLGCKIVEISALKNTGILDAAEEAIKAAERKKPVPMHNFSGVVEHALAHIEEGILNNYPESMQRWYAIKVFERDEKVLEKLNLSDTDKEHIEKDIQAAESELDDDSESLITNERYVYIAELLKGVYKKKQAGKTTVSDKIDKVVTNRWAALPIFAIIMFLVYFISVGPYSIGTYFTDWANDGLFGDGYHLLWIGSKDYNTAADSYTESIAILDAAIDDRQKDELKVYLDTESENFDAEISKNKLEEFINGLDNEYKVGYTITNDEDLSDENFIATKDDIFKALNSLYDYKFAEPSPEEYGVWVPGIPVLVTNGLEAIHCWGWLEGLIVDGIIAGVGAVLGFLPQMFILFIFLAFLEMCGYMSRIAFVLDRIFRKFGLSGKSFIPMLVGTGCGVPGIMASRTIENERDRRMTIMTTTFIPCSAKLPIIAMIAGAIFGSNAWWVAPSAYFIGMLAIIVSGIILKKTKPFDGEPAPFVMELPAYHMPTFGNVMHSMWERGWAFIKKAGTIILCSTIVIWFVTFFGFIDGQFRMLSQDEIGHSILAYIGQGLAWIFAPIGFGSWEMTVASFTGLVAKENIVGTMSIFFGSNWQSIGTAFEEVGTTAILSGYSFLIFNLLCAPCIAAMAAIKREMNSGKWTAFAILYQCGFAYAISLIFYQFGNLFTGNLNNPLNIVSFIFAALLLISMIYLLFRPVKNNKKSAKKTD